MSSFAVEVPPGGSLDLSIPEERFAEAAECRKLGNASFAAKDYAAAAASYRRGLEKHPQCHLLLSNLSACLLELGRPAEAAEAAEECVGAAPAYAKGFCRLARARLALGQLRLSREALERAQAIDAGDANVKATERRLLKEERRRRSNRRRRAEIYGDRENALPRDASAPDRQRQRDRRLIRQLSDWLSMSDGASHVLEGTFKRLLDPSEFRRTAFPGLTEAQLRGAPQSLQQMMEIDIYVRALEGAMGAVEAKARSVLDGVKRKGAARGDVMDPQTEAALWPSVLQEAFGRQLVKTVREVHRSLRDAAGRDPRLLASPEDDRAAWDQISAPRVAQLFDEGHSGFAVCDDFLGEEWTPLLADDLRALAEGGGLHDLPDEAGASSAGVRTAWLDRDAVRDHAGLSELLDALEALPYELNAKRGGARAARALPGSALLVSSGHGDTCGSLRPARDAGAGCILSCLYVLRADAQGGAVSLHDAGGAGGALDALELREDRLILWRSDRVWHARAALAGGTAQVVYFWIYRADGAELGTEPAAEDAAPVAREAPESERISASLRKPMGFLNTGCGMRCVCHP